MRRKILLVTAGIVLVLLATGVSGCIPGSPVQAGFPGTIGVNLNNQQQQGIWVSGQGKATVTPDIAILSLGISSQATSVAQAQSQATQAMDKVMNVLTSNGIDKKDIQTQRFSIQQVTRYDRDKQEDVVIGYLVTNAVTVKVRALDKTGPIIDAVAAAGGDLTRINGISFTVDNPKPYQDAARQDAMNDAKAKAQQMASLAGVTLGKPVYITESSYYPQPVPVPMPAIKGDVAASTPISPGEMDITISVQINYSIQ